MCSNGYDVGYVVERTTLERIGGSEFRHAPAERRRVKMLDG